MKVARWGRVRWQDLNLPQPHFGHVAVEQSNDEAVTGNWEKELGCSTARAARQLEETAHAIFSINTIRIMT
jgi:hypothetical protein